MRIAHFDIIQRYTVTGYPECIRVHPEQVLLPGTRADPVCTPGTPRANVAPWGTWRTRSASGLHPEQVLLSGTRGVPVGHPGSRSDPSPGDTWHTRSSPG